MTEDSLDSERLAAFLDGKLPTSERADVMRHLATTPEDYDVFVDAAVVRRKLLDDEESVAPPNDFSQVAEPASNRRSMSQSHRWKIWLPLAAVLIGALLIPRLLQRGLQDDVWLDASFIASAGPNTLDSALGATWYDPAWSTTRGVAETLTDDERAFRLGVRLTDLTVATQLSDIPAATRAQASINMLLASGDGSGQVAAALEALASAMYATDDQEQIDAAIRGVNTVVRYAAADASYLNLGIWSEKARLALLADRSDLAFSTASRTELSAVVEQLRSPDQPTSAAPTPLLTELNALASLLDSAPSDRQAVAAANAVRVIFEQAGG